MYDKAPSKETLQDEINLRITASVCSTLTSFSSFGKYKGFALIYLNIILSTNLYGFLLFPGEYSSIPFLKQDQNITALLKECFT